MAGRLVRRLVVGVLNALLFYVIALYPAYQMASFASDSAVHYTFVVAVLVLFGLYAAVARLFKNA